MSDGNANREKLRVIEIVALTVSILGFCGVTLFPQRVISNVIDVGAIPPVNGTVVAVTIMLGLARISFLLADIFAHSRIAGMLRRRCTRFQKAVQFSLVPRLPSPAAVDSLLIVTLVLFAFFLGILAHQRYGETDDLHARFEERWPTQALPNYDLAQLTKWRDANLAVIPVTYEPPSGSRPAAQLLADVKLSNNQKMASLKHSIEDLLGDRKLFVRIVELKHRKQSKRFYRMLAGPFESRSDVVKFCAAYNVRFKLHGRAACLPESASLEIRTTANETGRRPRPKAPSERLLEPHVPDFIFPRLFGFDKFI